MTSSVFKFCLTPKGRARFHRTEPTSSVASSSILICRSALQCAPAPHSELLRPANSSASKALDDLS